MTGLSQAWDALLGHPFDRSPHRETLLAAEAAGAQETVYPPREDWFAAFRLTPPERVRVVADACRERGIPIRVGVNSGSVEKPLLEKYGGPTAEAMAVLTAFLL